MRLSVSNIAWENNELGSHLGLLKDLGCDGVEIAPSCIWNEPVEASKDQIMELKELVERNDLVIPAFHALLYTRPDYYLFGDETVRKITVDYLKKLIALAGELSIKVLVYGSPKSRKVGDKPYEECYDTAVEVFKELGAAAQVHDACFCIEPLAASNTDFIQTADEGYRLVEDVGSEHFGLHLDARAMSESKEDYDDVFKRYGGVLKHFHVGDPSLAPPGTNGLDHTPIGKALSGSGYDGFVSIEMRRGFGDTKKVIKDAVRYVREKYFSEKNTNERL